MRSDLIALNAGTYLKLNLHKDLFLTLTASKSAKKMQERRFKKITYNEQKKALGKATGNQK